MRGRKPSGPRLVERAEGSRRAKLRLRTILETIAGETSIGEACAALGIGEAAFHKLRARVLQEAVESLEPRTPGRPPKEDDAASDEIESLEAQVQELERELQASRIREQLALTMPQILGERPEKKKRRRPI